ncbi:hypothetical protein, partial [Alistipes shahii]|uniref:hypothetical protein n=1 Tax=Alistipes shahii TaxID=328814 RepID=UPI003AF1DC85
VPFSAPVLTYRAKALASNMCSKVLNGHIILTDTSITTILAPEMTYTPFLFGFGVFNGISRNTEFSVKRVGLCRSRILEFCRPRSLELYRSRVLGSVGHEVWNSIGYEQSASASGCPSFV